MYVIYRAFWSTNHLNLFTFAKLCTISLTPDMCIDYYVLQCFMHLKWVKNSLLSIVTNKIVLWQTDRTINKITTMKIASLTLFFYHRLLLLLKTLKTCRKQRNRCLAPFDTFLFERLFCKKNLVLLWMPLVLSNVKGAI